MRDGANEDIDGGHGNGEEELEGEDGVHTLRMKDQRNSGLSTMLG